MNGLTTEVLIILGLILANGFFALSELSLVSARRSRLEELSGAGSKSARRALKLVDHPDRFLAAVQIGITFVGTFAAVYGGATIVKYLEPKLAALPIGFIGGNAEWVAVAIVVFAIAFVSIVLGELAPKYLALAHAEKIAGFVSRPMTILSKALKYFIPIFVFSAKTLLRPFGLREVKRGGVVSEMAVRLLMSEGRKSGVFDASNEELVRSALDFADTTAREAMTPRADIVAFSESVSFDTMMDTIAEEGYSRYPVYSESIDRIVGTVFLKDIVQRMRKSAVVSLHDVLRKPMFVPDSMELAELLKKMQSKHEHLAICLDEFGGTAGLITLEDILEEIVGEIQDETDEEVAEFSANSESVAFISGTLRPDQLNERFGSDLPENSSRTVAGMIVSALGRIPEKQESVRLNGLLVTVLERQGSRIVRMRVEKSSSTNISGKSAATS